MLAQGENHNETNQPRLVAPQWNHRWTRPSSRRIFECDILPYAESHYRVIADRHRRAIAGLSMGGMQTLNTSLPNLKQFASVSVLSSGWFRECQRHPRRNLQQLWTSLTPRKT
jgi:enterochelin esterase-like enzyme